MLFMFLSHFFIDCPHITMNRCRRFEIKLRKSSISLKPLPSRRRLRRLGDYRRLNSQRRRLDRLLRRTETVSSGDAAQVSGDAATKVAHRLRHYDTDPCVDQSNRSNYSAMHQMSESMDVFRQDRRTVPPFMSRCSSSRGCHSRRSAAHVKRSVKQKMTDLDNYIETEWNDEMIQKDKDVDHGEDNLSVAAERRRRMIASSSCSSAADAKLHATDGDLCSSSNSNYCRRRSRSFSSFFFSASVSSSSSASMVREGHGFCTRLPSPQNLERMYSPSATLIELPPSFTDAYSCCGSSFYHRRGEARRHSQADEDANFWRMQRLRFVEECRHGNNRVQQCGKKKKTTAAGIDKHQHRHHPWFLEQKLQKQQQWKRTSCRQGHLDDDDDMTMVAKYRPNSFDEIVGQRRAVAELWNSVEEGRIAPLYLFHGARGSGKSSTARVFAASMNCFYTAITVADAEEGSKRSGARKPCDLCRHCRNLASGQPSDVREISGGDNGAAAATNVRRLLRWARRPPKIGVYKVLILDDCHLLPRHAWDLLLAFFFFSPAALPTFLACVLITPSLDLLPAIAVSTIHHRLAFHRLGHGDIRLKLQRIVAMERIAIHDDALAMVTAMAGGSLRAAEATLVKLQRGCYGTTITAAAVGDLVGYVPEEKLKELLDLALSSDTANTVRCVREMVVETEVEPLMLMSQLANLITNLLASIPGDHRRSNRIKFTEGYRLRRALRILSEAEKQVRANNDRVTWLTAALLQFSSDGHVSDNVNGRGDNDRHSQEPRPQQQQLHIVGLMSSSSATSGGGTSITQSPFATADSTGSDKDTADSCCSSARHVYAVRKQQNASQSDPLLPQCREEEQERRPCSEAAGSVPVCSCLSEQKRSSLIKIGQNDVDHEAQDRKLEKINVRSAAAMAVRSPSCSSVQHQPQKQEKKMKSDHGDDCEQQSLKLEKINVGRPAVSLSSSTSRTCTAAAPEVIGYIYGDCDANRLDQQHSLLGDGAVPQNENRSCSQLYSTMDDIWEKVLDGSPSSVLRQTLSNEGGKLISLSVSQDQAVAHLEFGSMAEQMRAEARRAILAKSFQRALGCAVQVQIRLSPSAIAVAQSLGDGDGDTKKKNKKKSKKNGDIAATSEPEQKHRQLREHLLQQSNSNLGDVGDDDRLDMSEQRISTCSSDGNAMVDDSSCRSLGFMAWLNKGHHRSKDYCRDQNNNNSNWSSSASAAAASDAIAIASSSSPSIRCMNCQRSSTRRHCLNGNHNSFASAAQSHGSNVVDARQINDESGSSYDVHHSGGCMSPAYRPGLLCWRRMKTRRSLEGTEESVDGEGGC